MQPGNHNLPFPYLNRELTNRRLEILGFHFDSTKQADGTWTEYLHDSPVGRERYAAIQEIIAGAIAEWSDVHPDEDRNWEDIDNELQEWVQEWLVG